MIISFNFIPYCNWSIILNNKYLPYRQTLRGKVCYHLVWRSQFAFERYGTMQSFLVVDELRASTNGYVFVFRSTSEFTSTHFIYHDKEYGDFP